MPKLLSYQAAIADCEREELPPLGSVVTLAGMEGGFSEWRGIERCEDRKAVLVAFQKVPEEEGGGEQHNEPQKIGRE